ncbi:MAG: cupin domain-containing protein [Proteiniphilum sp.]
MKYGFFACLVLFLSSFNIYSQDKVTDASTDIEKRIDRFTVSDATKNRNGWFHYYIPKGMADTLTVKMSCVYEGTRTHAPHIHNEDEAFYIVKGPVRFHINGVEKVLNEGDFIYTPSGSSHNIQRISNDTIKYLVIKRESLIGLETPYSVGNVNYTFDDCHVPHENYDRLQLNEKTLLNKDFADGFQVTINKLGPNESYAYEDRALRQNAIYILQGKTRVRTDGQEAMINEDNTFYSPKGSGFTLTNINDEPLLFLSIITD